MIFASCGTSHFRFDRMMEALSALPPGELCVQHGPATPPACLVANAFLPFEEVVGRIEAADVIVTHAGVGSVICAIRAGHTPIIFPRLKCHAECVDDHQLELAVALAERGVAIMAQTPAELTAVIGLVPARYSVARTRSDSLVGAVRATIAGRLPELVG